MPSPACTKLAAARITCSSSPSANTTRFGAARSRWNTCCSTPATGSRRDSQRVAVGLHVLDRLARHAGVHRRLRHRGRHVRNQPRIERHRDDVVRPELRPRAVGRGDLVGHVLAGEFGERAGGGDLHLHVDGGGADVERAAEDVGKAQHVVDLVRIVRAAGRHDGVVAHLGHLLGGDLRVGIGHGEDDRLWRHRGDHLLGHRALGRQPVEHVGALHARRPACAPWSSPRAPTSTGSCRRCGPGRSRPWCRTGSGSRA